MTEVQFRKYLAMAQNGWLYVRTDQGAIIISQFGRERKIFSDGSIDG